MVSVGRLRRARLGTAVTILDQGGNPSGPQFQGACRSDPGGGRAQFRRPCRVFLVVEQFPFLDHLRRRYLVGGSGFRGAATSAAAGSSGASSTGGTYTWWDPYPQHEAGSDWDKRVEACGSQAG